MLLNFPNFQKGGASVLPPFSRICMCSKFLGNFAHQGISSWAIFHSLNQNFQNLGISMFIVTVYVVNSSLICKEIFERSCWVFSSPTKEAEAEEISKYFNVQVAAIAHFKLDTEVFDDDASRQVQGATTMLK